MNHMMLRVLRLYSICPCLQDSSGAGRDPHQSSGQLRSPTRKQHRIDVFAVVIVPPSGARGPCSLTDSCCSPGQGRRGATDDDDD